VNIRKKLLFFLGSSDDDDELLDAICCFNGYKDDTRLEYANGTITLPLLLNKILFSTLLDDIAEM
jgi:hypothetical protein